MSGEPLWSTRTNQITGAVAAVLSVVAAASGIVASYKADKASESAKAAELALQDRTENRETLVAERDWQLKVFEKAYEALETDEQRQQQAALALVLTLSDGALRNGIISAINSTGEPGVRALASQVIAEETEFKAQEISDARAREAGTSGATLGQGTEILSAKTTGYDVDVFWCQGGSDDRATRARAKQLGDRLAVISRENRRLAGEQLGRISLKALPASTNATPAYRYATDVVVYDPAIAGKPEAPVAMEIQKQARDVLKADVEARPENGSTEWYLSVFVCASQAT